MAVQTSRLTRKRLRFQSGRTGGPVTNGFQAERASASPSSVSQLAGILPTPVATAGSRFPAKGVFRESMITNS